MAAISTSPVMIDEMNEKLTNEIFAILENKFLFGYHEDRQILNNPSGKVRILSIDSGASTDGVLAATTLLHLQSTLRRKSGIPNAQIADFFDVVTGAGVGGVLAGMLFTRAKDGGAGPIFTAEESLQFVIDNSRKLSRDSRGLFTWRRRSKAEKALSRVFGESTLKDTVKAVLIPCYDLRSGAPLLFSRADAMEMDGCDFTMAGVCSATVADRALELKSADGTRRVVAVGGGMGIMSNPTAAAITHVLNNKQEFPLCKGVQDLLVVSLGNGELLDSGVTMPSLRVAADGAAADMVDQAVAMAFGEWRTSNYVRIQGTIGTGKRTTEKMVDEMLGQKNVESILFKGKKLVETTNMEKLEMFAGELIKEQHRRRTNINTIFPTVQLKNNNNNNNDSNNSSNVYSPSRSSSATSTLSSLSSSN